MSGAECAFPGSWDDVEHPLVSQGAGSEGGRWCEGLPLMGTLFQGAVQSQGSVSRDSSREQER